MARRTRVAGAVRGVGRALLRPGAATNVCCESTARDAMMLDYRSIMVSDALASFTEPEHTSALHNWMLYFGDVLDADGVIRRLEAGRSEAPRGRSVPVEAG